MSAFAKAITSNLRLRSSRSASAPPTDECPSTSPGPPGGSSSPSGSGSPGKNRGGYTVADIKLRLFNQGLKIEADLPKVNRVKPPPRSRFKDYFQRRWPPPNPGDNLWTRADFLVRFLPYLRARDLPAAAAVSRHWLAGLAASGTWSRLAFVIDFHRVQVTLDRLQEMRLAFERRRCPALLLRHMNDLHVAALLEVFAPVEGQVQHLKVELSMLTDRGLERLTDCFSSAQALDLIGCNDISEVALWSCLSPRLTALTIQDCVHVADDTLGAVSQLLPNLKVLNLQAYHISDLSLSYFNSRQGNTVERVRLTHCMEVTNRGLLNLVQALPNLRHLSLAGCSKINDDGIDLLCENLKHLLTLDLSWCGKVTDGGLECIACDLQALEELYLDRCALATDVGVGYLTNLPKLRQLSLRFCHGLTDVSLSHLSKLSQLRCLSVAGCKQLSAEALLREMVRFPSLRRLEVTNCPSVTLETKEQLSKLLPSCVLLD